MVDVIAIVVERAINYFRRLPVGATSVRSITRSILQNCTSVDSIILFNHALPRNFASVAFAIIDTFERDTSNKIFNNGKNTTVQQMM